MCPLPHQHQQTPQLKVTALQVHHAEMHIMIVTNMYTTCNMHVSMSGTLRREFNHEVLCQRVTIVHAKLLVRFAYCGRLIGHNGGVCALSSNDGTIAS